MNGDVDVTWVTMDRDDDITKVSRTLMGMDEEHHECDFVLNSIMNWKPRKTG